MTGLRGSSPTEISGTAVCHSRTVPSTSAASRPAIGARMVPWLSDASRLAVSSLSAGTSGAMADSSSVLASRSSAA